MLPPGSTVGILGGGQLGRMLSLAAAELGFKTHIYCPPGDNPAIDVSAAATLAAYDDGEALARFADAIDVVTYEFENVPVDAAEFLDARVPVWPAPKALAVAQDRLDEKTFLNSIGVATARFARADDPRGIRQALDEVGLPAILKARRFGYDGKGQAYVASLQETMEAIDLVAAGPCILEEVVRFAAEISVIVARDCEGSIACYEPGENTHKDHILATTVVPAAWPSRVLDEARRIATRIVETLDYVGVMGVEMFVTHDENVLVNEIAPRVHNSGHWTIDACLVSQFEQHIRAVCGWPLGDPARHSDARMVNLIGADIEEWRSAAAKPGIALHVYGKREAREGRKMGHLTIVSPRSED